MSLRRDFRGIAQVVAIDFDDEIAEAGGAQIFDGFQDDMNALVVDHLAEEAEAISPIALVSGAAAGAVVSLAVRDVMNPRRIDAPFDVELQHEAAGRREGVDRLEMLLQPHLAQKEEFRREFGKTLMTTNAGRLLAQRLVGAPNHLPVGRADRHELVKGEDDARARQGLAGDADEIDAKGEKMMEMDDVGLDQLQELDIGFHKQRIGRLVPGVVVVAAQKQKFAGAAVESGDPARRS